MMNGMANTFWQRVKDYFPLLSSLMAKSGIIYGALFILNETNSSKFGVVAWLSAAFLLFSLVLILIEHRITRWQIHLYMVVQTIIVSTVMILEPNLNFFTILFYVLCIEAIALYSDQMGYIWIIIYIILSIIILSMGRETDEGVVLILIYLAGFFFFISFARTTLMAEKARQDSERLLSELQLAHRQLQEYMIQSEELAVSEERNRLAREMHDTIGHRLTVSSVQLEGAGKLIERDPTKAAEMVQTVRDEVREALGELRRTVATLRDPLEADLPLHVSIQRLVESFEHATSLNTHILLPEHLGELDKQQRLAVYRATQEALTNIQKHAEATQVWIQLEKRPGQLTLRVSDNGQGFSNHNQTGGLGLRGLRERAELLGGQFSIGDRPGGGTLIIFQIPLEDDDAG